jgi:cellulose synthase/poly-beta-1,6-N-acetylglucosamine synthase-like glycosyltransferase
VTAFLIVFIALAGLYIVVTLGLAAGIGRETDHITPGPVPVTVLICAHNEAANIDACLTAIADQTYASELTQVIVVDDRSSDGTAEIALGWQDRIQNLQVLTVDEQLLACPKKNALQLGISRASGEIILTTDADCLPTPGWIHSTVSTFTDGVGLVAGPAPLTDPGGRWSALLVFQGLVVNALSAGSAGIGIPLSSSGRNLAYRRSAFTDAGGYERIGHITGGDDVLLMRNIHRSGWRVAYNSDPGAAVHSLAHLDGQWSRQTRYQSKAKHYDIPILSVAVLIYIFHVLLLAGPVWAWLAPETLPFLFLVLLTKAFADGVFLWKAAERFHTRDLLRWIPVVEILIVPYIAVVCAVGTLRHPTWT